MKVCRDFWLSHSHCAAVMACTENNLSVNFVVNLFNLRFTDDLRSLQCELLRNSKRCLSYDGECRRNKVLYEMKRIWTLQRRRIGTYLSLIRYLDVCSYLRKPNKTLCRHFGDAQVCSIVLRQGYHITTSPQFRNYNHN